MLGKNSKDEQLLNIPARFFIFVVFHFEMSGNFFKNLHPENINCILITLSVFHFEILGNNNKEEHPKNI